MMGQEDACDNLSEIKNSIKTALGLETVRDSSRQFETVSFNSFRSR